MDQKQIEKLMKAMEESRIKRVVIKEEGFEIEIERECASSESAHAYYTPPAQPHPVHPIVENKPKGLAEPFSHADSKEIVKSGSFVTSPMVGTYYGAPSPEDPPFIKVGDTVNENTVVCIIEAMKVMNEVKAGIKGTVAEVMMRSGDPVEFGTRILRIEPQA